MKSCLTHAVVLTNLKPCLFAVLKLYCTWNNLSKLWNECHKKLEDSLQMALHYQDTMQVCVYIQYILVSCVYVHTHILTNISWLVL